MLRNYALLFLFAASVVSAAWGQAEDSSSVLVSEGATAEEILRLAAAVRPHPRQEIWQRMGFTAFVHFGMNTFTDREWGDGKESPKDFAPESFDARQWVQTFAAAGMKGLVLTAKHHDGFCLWPTKTTEHSVRQSSWRDGQGDVVAEVARACREEGLRFGIYLSPWDRNATSFGTPAYDDLFHAQLEELLTNYGPLYDLWLDGAKAPKDPKLFNWSRHFAAVRRHQPWACLSIVGPDVRWCGNEAGSTRRAEWSVIPLATDEKGSAVENPAVAAAYRAVPVTARDLGSRSALEGARRLVWWPAVTNTSIRPGWFYHAAQDGEVRGLRELFDLWVSTVGGNSHLLLNVPPDRRGLIQETDARRLRALGGLLEATFGRDLADGGRRRNYDGRVGEVYFDEPVTADYLSLEEDVAGSGQRVEAFRVDTWDGGSWREALRGGTIGMRRIIALPERPVLGYRYWVTASRGTPAVKNMSVHRRPRILAAPTIARDRAGRVSIAATPGASIFFTVDGSAPDKTSSRYEGPFAFASGGVVRALALPPEGAEIFSAGDAASASMRFGLAKTGWRVLEVSSEQAPGEAAALAFDEDPSTIWHSRYSPDTPAYPHALALDLGALRRIDALRYTPRSSGSNGTVRRYSIEVSRNGQAWRRVIDGAEFGNMKTKPGPRDIALPEAVEARYLRFIALEEVEGRPWASVAELDVFLATP
jgi:alpha-L-fucosidase